MPLGLTKAGEFQEAGMKRSGQDMSLLLVLKTNLLEDIGQSAKLRIRGKAAEEEHVCPRLHGSGS